MQRNGGAGPVILFAGTVSYTVKDCLDLLVDLIASGKLKEYQLPNASLHLCTPPYGCRDGEVWVELSRRH